MPVQMIEIQPRTNISTHHSLPFYLMCGSYKIKLKEKLYVLEIYQELKKLKQKEQPPPLSPTAAPT